MIFRNCSRGTAVGLAALCFAAFGTCRADTVSAGPDADNRVVIQFVRADLDQPGAAKLLYRRIQSAAGKVCQGSTRREPVLSWMYQKCIDRTVDDAVTQIDAAALTELHRRRVEHIS